VMVLLVMMRLMVQAVMVLQVMMKLMVQAVMVQLVMMRLMVQVVMVSLALFLPLLMVSMRLMVQVVRVQLVMMKPMVQAEMEQLGMMKLMEGEQGLKALKILTLKNRDGTSRGLMSNSRALFIRSSHAASVASFPMIISSSWSLHTAGEPAEDCRSPIFKGQSRMTQPTV